MIWDSIVWKDELRKNYIDFQRYLIDIFSDEYDVDHFVLGLEKFYFLCSFIIRKIIESKKISDEIKNKQYKCARYKRINSKVVIDRLNAHKFGQFYDLMSSENCKLKPNLICNMFIHSFIFSPVFDEDFSMEFMGVFVNSDYSKESYVYLIDYEVFFELINDVINDEISCFKINTRTRSIQK